MDTKEKGQVKQGKLGIYQKAKNHLQELRASGNLKN